MSKNPGASSTASIAKALGKTASSASSVRASLIKRQVIEQTAKGYVDFSIPYMRQYLIDYRDDIMSRYGE